MGNVAVSVVSKGVVGNQRIVLADVTFSSSYATGGDTIKPSDLGLSRVESAWAELAILPSPGAFVHSGAHTPSSVGVQAVLAGTASAPLLKAYNGSTSEVSAATNLSTDTLRIEFRGR